MSKNLKTLLKLISITEEHGITGNILKNYIEDQNVVYGRTYKEAIEFLYLLCI